MFNVLKVSKSDNVYKKDMSKMQNTITFESSLIHVRGLSSSLSVFHIYVLPFCELTSSGTYSDILMKLIFYYINFNCHFGLH
jgi:hypothetical protein